MWDIYGRPIDPHEIGTVSVYQINGGIAQGPFDWLFYMDGPLTPRLVKHLVQISHERQKLIGFDSLATLGKWKNTE